MTVSIFDVSTVKLSRVQTRQHIYSDDGVASIEFGVDINDDFKLAGVVSI